MRSTSVMNDELAENVINIIRQHGHIGTVPCGASGFILGEELYYQRLAQSVINLIQSLDSPVQAALLAAVFRSVECASSKRTK